MWQAVVPGGSGVVAGAGGAWVEEHAMTWMTDTCVRRLVTAACLALGVGTAPAWSAGAADTAGDASPAAGAAKGTIDMTKDGFRARLVRDTVYRFDLLAQELVPVPRKEWKPGHVYYRFHSRLGRHVWSIAGADGGFRYAIGPGSVQQTRQFDLRATPEERQRLLRTRAPEMARLLEIQGTLPTVRLDADEGWQLNVGPTVTSVFDLETGRRWEWHGSEPVGVIHSGGSLWSATETAYLPIDPVRPPVLPLTAADCPCPVR